MKTAFVSTLLKMYEEKSFVFLTGDLGFNMLEPLRDKLGDRFINCGVAEQNMVGMAAGMAKAGEEVWVYSIAPFLYARAFEQIRNDVCFHNLPVKLCGMGGGFHYGNLGPTHWALEDYGTLLTLPNIKCYIPAFADDVEPILRKMRAEKKPGYLRLGRCEKPKDFNPGKYDGARYYGETPSRLITCGTIAGKLLENIKSILIISEIPTGLVANFGAKVIEEHVRHGGLGQLLGFPSFNASYLTGPYGSQQYMRERCGLTAEKVLEALRG